MKSLLQKPVLAPVAIGLIGLASAGLAQAQQERARVVSSTPIVQQVAVPQQVCQDQTVRVRGQTSGAGAIMGGIAGGAMGNAIGDGNGRAAATLIGLVGGAIVGNHIEGRGPDRYETVRNCSTQTSYQNQVVGYDVTYRYAGRTYTMQTQEKPGRYVYVDVTPVSSYQAPAPVAVQPAVQYAPPPRPAGITHINAQILLDNTPSRGDRYDRHHRHNHRYQY